MTKTSGKTNPKPQKISIQTLQNKKNHEKITAVTAYDALFGSLFDGEVDVILVGDSLKMSFGGSEDTLDATLEEMIYHTKAVCMGVSNSFVIADMPFGSYGNAKNAVKNATKIYKQTRADAVKLEGGKNRAKILHALVQEGIAAVGHVGLMPQFVRSEGGYKIKGKGEEESAALLEDALSLEEAGACMIVLEGIRTHTAKEITKRLSIPTVGIGSGTFCDGQILVWSDLFGLFERFSPKFARKYLQGASLFRNALRAYAADVKSGAFPNEKESWQ